MSVSSQLFLYFFYRPPPKGGEKFQISSSLRNATVIHFVFLRKKYRRVNFRRLVKLALFLYHRYQFTDGVWLVERCFYIGLAKHQFFSPALRGRARLYNWCFDWPCTSRDLFFDF